MFLMEYKWSTASLIASGIFRQSQKMAFTWMAHSTSLRTLRIRFAAPFAA
jgi:hypothetical protein